MSDDARCAYAADPERRYRCRKRAARGVYCKRHAAQVATRETVSRYETEREAEARAERAEADGWWS